MSRTSARSEQQAAPAGRGLFIGRFQPFHRGHLEAIRRIRERRPEEPLLVGIGSAQYSYTSENPFTSGERMEMVLRAAEAAGLSGVLPVPVPDIHRHQLWVRYVVGLLPAFGRVYTNNPLTRALFSAEGIEVEAVPWVDRPRLEGTRIREAMVRGSGWEAALSPAVRAYLVGIGAPARLALLAASDHRSEPEATEP